MERKQVETDTVLLDFLMDECGFSTRTRARTTIKAGRVTVNGAVVKIPSTALVGGSVITWQSLGNNQKAKDFDIGGPTGSKSAASVDVASPYEIVHEDDFLIAYIKPAGMVFASPNPAVKTSYTRMREWMQKARPNCKDVHFVNRIEKESSGICLIAKELLWRKHLQSEGDGIETGLYIIVEGHLPPDDIITAFEPGEGKSRGPLREFPYRTMRATSTHTMLKFQTGFKSIPVLMSGLRRHGCMIVGKGKEAPDPMGRSGLHLYACQFTGPGGEVLEIKTRVPQAFLQLMKGGKGPRAIPGKSDAKKTRSAQDRSRKASKPRSN